MLKGYKIKDASYFVMCLR